MRNRDVMRAATFHVVQSTPASCVAACICMVRRRCGETICEADLLAEWGSDGPFALQLYAQDLREAQSPKFINPDTRSSREFLVGMLQLGHWVIVTIVPLPHPNRPHAIVLVGMTGDDTFVYLDPCERTEAQPLAFSEDDFVRQWTGELVVVAVPDPIPQVLDGESVSVET